MDRKSSKSYYPALYVFILGLFIPVFAQAFSLTQTGTQFKTVIAYIVDIIGTLTPILFALAFMVFFWGLSKFILHSGNAAEVAKGRDYMLWGILALFLLITSLAIIKFLMGELGFTDAPPLLPENVPDTSTSVNLIY